jgi:hypothetical protein
LRLRAVCEIEDFCRVAGDIANRGIDLGYGNFE